MTCTCGGTLQKYTGKEGGRLVPFLVNRHGAIKGFGDIEVRPVGGMLACNRCEHCEAL